jgi:toxin ParE1/3/4
MSYEVSLTKDAERDLEGIYYYIAERDSRASADHVLDRLVQATDALRSSPDRGSYVNELRSLGISEYRQIFFKPYRLIYRVHAQQGIVYVVADGRWDMGSLLARRLLGAIWVFGVFFGVEVIKIAKEFIKAMQWSQSFANSKVGALSSNVGEFKDGQVVLIGQDTVNDRTILVRAVWSDIKSYSNDGRTTWVRSFIANLMRLKQ